MLEISLYRETAETTFCSLITVEKTAKFVIFHQFELKLRSKHWKTAETVLCSLITVEKTAKFVIFHYLVSEKH